MRLIAAALLAGAAGVLSGGGWYTLGSIVELVWRHAALLLVGLAAVNLLRAVAPRGALIGPVVLVVCAAGVYVSQHGWSARLSAPAAAAAGLVLIALLVIAASPPSKTRAIAIAWVHRRTVRGSAAREMTVVAILGVVGLDLRAAEAPDGETMLRCFVAGGRIEVSVPARADVRLSSDSDTWLVRVSDDGAEPATGGRSLVRIRLRGAVGGFALRRS